MTFTNIPARNIAPFYPYLIDIQNNYISELETRIVIPLGKAEYFNNEVMTKLHFKVSYDSQDLILMTPQISSISRKLLTEPLGSLAHLKQAIIDALDFAITCI